MASPQVALGYALLAVICYVVGMREASETSLAADVGSKATVKSET